MENQKPINNPLDSLDSGDMEDFIHAYFAAALATSGLDIEQQMHNKLAMGEDVHMRKSCFDFLRVAGIVLTDEIENRGSYSWEQAGTDFWLTRNGLHTIFLARDLKRGDWLCRIAQQFGRSSVRLGGDDKLYVTNKPVHFDRLSINYHLALEERQKGSAFNLAIQASNNKKKASDSERRIDALVAQDALVQAVRKHYADSECPHYPVSDWTYLIASDDLRQGYWEFVSNRIEEVFGSEVTEHFGLDGSFNYLQHPDKLLRYVDDYFKSLESTATPAN